MAEIIEFYSPQSLRMVAKCCRQTNAASCWSFQRRCENPRDRAWKTHGEGVSRGLKAK
jgi:hypothetical protein